MKCGIVRFAVSCVVCRVCRVWKVECFLGFVVLGGRGRRGGVGVDRPKQRPFVCVCATLGCALVSAFVFSCVPCPARSLSGARACVSCPGG